MSALGPPNVLTIADLRRLAQRRLPRAVFDYIDGGAEDEVTLRANRRAFEEVVLRPRGAVVTEEVDLRTTALGAELARCCAQARRLHFVTHSLGGVLLRAYLAERALPNLARVVMLAPPNHGSELADVVRRSRALRVAFGPTATELGTDSASLPNRLPPADFEVGVIAGTSTVNPIGSWLIPADDDGTVSVASARLEGMRDFVTLPVSHTLILLSGEATRQTIAFLQHGRFAHAEAESTDAER